MQAQIETLKAKNSNDEEYLVYPRTLIKCVTNENGDNFEDTMKDFVATEIADVIDGTTQVGNAKTLDGHGAEYFVNRTDVLTGSESVLEKAKTLSYGMWNFRFNNHDGTDLPNAYYSNGCATVFVRTSSHITVVLWGSYYGASSGMQTNHYNGVTWTGWIGEFTTAGGILGNGIDHFPLVIKGNDAKRALIGFRDANNATLGYLGIFGTDNPVFAKSDSNNGTSTSHTLLHTGNKPTGTYTGNGSTVKRTIATGGTGRFILIFGDNGTSAIASKGAIGREGATVKSLTASEVDTDNSNLYIISNDACINANGVVYTYYVA